MFRRFGGAAAVALTSLALLGSLSGQAAALQPHDQTDPMMAETTGTDSSRISQYEDGLTVDATSYAADYGVTLDQARAALSAQRSAGEALARLEAEFPDSYAGGWIRHTPQAHGVAWFVGSAVPPRAYEVVGADPVTLHSGAGLTLVDLERRSDIVHTDLVEQDRPQVTTSYDVTSGQVEVSVKLRPEEVGLPRETLMAGLPSSARSPGVIVEFSAADISGDEHTRGGAKTPDAAGYCTTGFTVWLGGVTGFLTAGHCGNDRDYQEPETLNGYDADFQAQHKGEWGDFQWHSTPTHTVYPEFYTSDVGIRSVQAPSGTISLNQYVCKYGRGSDYDCSNVFRLSIKVTMSGITYKRIVATDDHITDAGDSGGPWFLVYDPLGVHKGYTTIRSAERSIFSAVGNADNALGVLLLV